MQGTRAMVLVGLIGVAGMSAAQTQAADKPALVKPPWQRLLRGEDDRKAAAQERQLEQLQTAGKFDDALKVAQALADLRSKAQGADHWEAINARWLVQSLRHLLRQDERGRADYARSLSLMSQGVALVRRALPGGPAVAGEGAGDLPESSGRGTP